MSEYYHVVPWYNSEEWHEVYDKIYSPTSSFVSKEEAVSLLLIWKARCPSLPSGVESTLTLLEVNLQDLKHSEHGVSERLLRLAYSSAIMRFVNHMLDTETAKGTSLYQAAKNLDIPDWIIDMRHDTAHSNNLPSTEILREASLIGLDWLQKYYWNKYSQHIQDYTAGQIEPETIDADKVAALMNFCLSLSICAHSKCKIKKLSAIPDPAMRESIISDARDLFGDQIDFSNLKTVSVAALLNTMKVESKKFLKKGITASHVNKALLSEDSIILSLDLLNHLGNNDFNRKKKLNRSYVQCFEVLLTFLHSNDLLLDFILELINISQSTGNGSSHRPLLAALWVSEILKSLQKCKSFVEMMKMKNPDEKSWMGEELKSLFHHWFPNEKINGLLLDLLTPVPKELTDINFIQPIISEYNPYLTYFIKDLLSLIQPNLPAATTNKICNLAKLISSPENFTEIPKRIYTVDDLKCVENRLEHNEYDSDCVELNVSNACDPTHNKINEQGDQGDHGIWTMASGEHSWSTCPIGQLPWQQKAHQCGDVLMEME